MKFTVKQARNYAGLTQAEIAKRLKIDRGTYMRIEKDVLRATVKQLNDISKITGVPLSEIFLPIDSTLVDTQ